MNMNDRLSKFVTIIIVCSMLFSGCMNESDDGIENESNDVEDIPEIEPKPEDILEIKGTDFCDLTNQIHCMLPFPSGFFLDYDESQITDYRLNITGEAIPDTKSAQSENMVILDRLDGFSPSTQIFTAFSSIPDIGEMADQFNISPSIEINHSSILINLDTGEFIHHWIELDARAKDGEDTLIFVRTLQGLDHDAAYAVAFRNLVDVNGEAIQPEDGFLALRNNQTTDSIQIENQREDYEYLFEKLEQSGVPRSNLQSAWWFHTASTKSILKDLFSIRDDAENRLGDVGISCTITNVIEDYGDDNTALRVIQGTVTTPQYMQTEYARSPMVRNEDGDPVFVENREIDFSMMIPKSLAENNTSGPISVFGHGLFGDSDAYVKNGRAIANEYQTVLLATDFKGWSSDGDEDAMTFALMDLKEFQYQQERQLQAVINHLAMIRTIAGGQCDEEYFKHNGTLLIDYETINYIGISLGGLRGPSLLSICLLYTSPSPRDRG